MEGKVKYKDRKGEIVKSEWLGKAKRRKHEIVNYHNLVAVEWEDGGLSWTNKKVLEKV